MKRLFLFILLMASFAYSANRTNIGDCIPGFTDYITVQVVDSNSRLMDGANVYIKYQLDKTTNHGFVDTKNYTTDSSGTLNITIHNIETDPDKVDCDFTVHASYGKSSASGSYTVGARPSQIVLSLDAYPVTLKITDQFKSPISGARVWINGVERVSDKYGLVSAYVNPGPVSVLVEYLDGTLQDSLQVDSDYYNVIPLQIYAMSINVLDDSGKPLVANATVGGENYTSDENGTIAVSRIMNFAPQAKITYGNLEKDIEIDLRIKTKYNAIFDFTPPKIGEVSITQTKKASKLIIPISDSSAYASGIASGGVAVKYKAGDSGNWVDISTYLAGKDKYAAEIPIQKPDTIVHFSVDAKDNDGNRAHLEGEFVSSSTSQNSTIQIPQDNSSANSSTTVSPSEVKSEEFPTLYAVVGFIILVVVIYAVYRYIQGRKGGEVSA